MTVQITEATASKKVLVATPDHRQRLRRRMGARRHALARQCRHQAARS